MRRLKVLGLVLTAACVVGVLTVAGASAMTLPFFSPGTLQNFTGTSGVGVLTSGGISITCKLDESAGGMENSHLGTFAIAFKKCTTVGGLIKCNSLADATETILTVGSWHLVLKLVTNVDRRFILFLLAHLHLECGNTLSLVLGTLLASISPEKGATKFYELGVKVKSGAQEFTEYENEGSTIVSAGLKSAVNEGAQESATEESASNMIDWEKSVEILN